MNIDFVEQRMLNWARDYIKQETFQHGKCDEKKFKEVFKRFKAASGYKKTHKDLLRILKEGGYIDRMTKEFKWEMM